ncbi:MAG: nitrate- and nitrite sensing domain-containing protein, partial [Acidimicrobiales bacterium]|nr:nitrate- and nitrite sensing domain-containing protein [Acidimicrobiales bacterium]
MRRVPIRLKLAAALSIPLVALGVVTVLEVVKSADEVAEIRSQTDLAEAAIGPSGLVTALQNERTWPAVDLVGQTGVVDMPVEGYEDTRAATDQALADFEQLISSKGGSVREAYREPLEQLAAIDQLRADIDANIAAVNPRTIDNNFAFSHEIFQRYSDLVQPFFDATTRISLAIDDPELRQGTELADTATRQIEEMSLLLNGAMGDAMSEGGIDTTAEIAASSIRLHRLQNNADVLRNASGPYAA